MNFVGILKKIGMIAGQTAPQIISLVSPPLGALVNTVMHAVLLSEAKVGPGNGEAKKQEALQAIQVAVPLVLQLMEQQTKKDLADDALFASGVEKLTDGLVDIMNAFRVLPKPAA